MLKFLRRYEHIILSWKLTRYEQYGSSLRLRMEIELIDESKLFVRETILEGRERRYAYHWQTKGGGLLLRWDNAPHWEVKTFPHHKHIGEVSFVEPSYERTLDQVFKAIAQRLQKSKE